jgi:glutathione S-transferase
MRASVLIREFGIEFEEVMLRFDGFSPESQFKQRVAEVSPAGQVPVLVDADRTVWDTIAIAEYLAERFPERSMWPEEAAHRARARSICAEMHGGFSALRSACPMNIEARLPDVGALTLRDKPAVRVDPARRGGLHGASFSTGQRECMDRGRPARARLLDFEEPYWLTR